MPLHLFLDRDRCTLYVFIIRVAAQARVRSASHRRLYDRPSRPRCCGARWPQRSMRGEHYVIHVRLGHVLIIGAHGAATACNGRRAGFACERWKDGDAG